MRPCLRLISASPPAPQPVAVAPFPFLNPNEELSPGVFGALLLLPPIDASALLAGNAWAEARASQRALSLAIASLSLRSVSLPAFSFSSSASFSSHHLALHFSRFSIAAKKVPRSGAIQEMVSIDLLIANFSKKRTTIIPLISHNQPITSRRGKACNTPALACRRFRSSPHRAETL